MRAPPLQGSDGNFYGTTLAGGLSGCAGYGCGTVYEITPSGTLATLYWFCNTANCADGVGPFAALVEGPDGDFYGTTSGQYAGSSIGASDPGQTCVQDHARRNANHPIHILQSEQLYKGCVREPVCTNDLNGVRAISKIARGLTENEIRSTRAESTTLHRGTGKSAKLPNRCGPSSGQTLADPQRGHWPGPT